MTIRKTCLVIILLFIYGVAWSDCSSETPYPHVVKKDGTFDSRQNDLWELAQDWYFYRWKILERHQNGDVNGANKARNGFQQINYGLEQYPAVHSQKALDKAGSCSRYR